MRGLRTVLLAFLLLPLAGCVHKDAPAAPASSGGAAGASALAPAAVNGTPAPTWTVGQSWSHKWTLVSGGNLTFLVKTVVAESDAGGWTLATDNQTIAAFHGAFVFPTLGRFTTGLAQSVGTSRFPWYHFPLLPNATWTDSVVLYDGTKDTKLDIRGRVTGVQHGTSDVYRIEMATGDRVVATYDYDTKTQWFNEALFYGDDGTLQFRLEMQETGRAFKGRLYDDTGAFLMDHEDLVVPSAGVVQPSPPQDFAMAADQNQLLLFLISFAAGGGHDSEVIAPDGQRFGAQAFDGVVAPFYNDSRVLVVPGQAGTWHCSTAGAGALVAGGVIQAYGLHERVIDL
jgi:hypothetical protein